MLLGGPNRRCPRCDGIAVDIRAPGLGSVFAADAIAFMVVLPLLAVGAAVHVVGYLLAFLVVGILIARWRSTSRTYKCLHCKAEFIDEPGGPQR